MKKLTVILCLLLIFVLGGCTPKTDNNKLTVAVSIEPQKTFVEKVSGNKATVITMIPAGASAENYEMTPKEIATFNNSNIYFSIGVPAEEKGIIPHINKDTKHYDLTVSVEEKYPIVKIGNERDPHIWLSPKRVVIMVEEIQKQLSVLDPKNSEFYKKNADAYIKELQSLDKEIQMLFRDKKKKAFYISHPSYGYFSADYGLEMVALENEGHETTPKELASLISNARQSGVKIIFCQEESSKKQAEIFAKEIGGRVKILTPLSPDYTNSLRRTAELIYEAVNQ